MEQENKNVMPMKSLCDVSIIKPRNCTSLVNLLSKGEMVEKYFKQLTMHYIENPIKFHRMLYIDGDICTNNENMANAFNNYIASICTTIQAPSDNVISHTSYFNTSVHSTFNFKTISNVKTQQSYPTLLILTVVTMTILIIPF